MTAAAMFALAAGKARTALGNPVLRTEGRVTTIDGILACALLLGPHPQRRRRIVVGRPRRRIRARLLRRPLDQRPVLQVESSGPGGYSTDPGR